VVWERDRRPTITVQADVQHGAQGIDVTTQIDKALLALRQRLPVGCISVPTFWRPRRRCGRRRTKPVRPRHPCFHR
jgi:hypothetical protein